MEYRDISQQDAVSEHRRMWNWISEQCIEQKKVVTKDDYFNYLKIPYPDRPAYQEPLCSYCSDESKGKSFLQCWRCPLDFPRLDLEDYKPPRDQPPKPGKKPVVHGDTGMCWFSDNPYSTWRDTIALNKSANYAHASEIAKQIASIPEYQFAKIMPWD